MTCTYLAERMRTVAADPTPLALIELKQLAAQVERMERFVDGLADTPCGDDGFLVRPA